jgi:glutathione S-transferase
MPRYTAIVTLLAIALYFFFATRVAVAHGKFGVKLPATTGNLDFERVFRAHENTLERQNSNCRTATPLFQRCK